MGSIPALPAMRKNSVREMEKAIEARGFKPISIHVNQPRKRLPKWYPYWEACVISAHTNQIIFVIDGLSPISDCLKRGFRIRQSDTSRYLLVVESR